MTLCKEGTDPENVGPRTRKEGPRAVCACPLSSRASASRARAKRALSAPEVGLSGTRSTRRRRSPSPHDSRNRRTPGLWPAGGSQGAWGGRGGPGGRRGGRGRGARAGGGPQAGRGRNGVRASAQGARVLSGKAVSADHVGCSRARPKAGTHLFFRGGTLPAVAADPASFAPAAHPGPRPGQRLLLGSDLLPSRRAGQVQALQVPATKKPQGLGDLLLKIERA